MNINLNEFAKEVHKNAVEHGWWESERELYEILALIHSEWSEALEEYRAERPLVWYADNGKPEGIAVELIDGCIRILDYLAHVKREWGVLGSVDLLEEHAVEDDMCIATGEPMKDVSLTWLVYELHWRTSKAWQHEYMHLVFAIAFVFAWIRAQGLDPVKIMLEKHEYNKTRPYKHGKKC